MQTPILALFALSFIAAIIFIVSMVYAGEDCLTGKVSCFTFGI